MTTRRPGATLLLISLGLTWGTAAVQAKIGTLSLLKKTRTAELIVTGRVTEAAETKAVVKVGQVLKGRAARPQVALSWPPVRSIEDIPIRLQPGDEVLVFALEKDGAYEPLAAWQGVISLPEDAREEQVAAIRAILELDAAAPEDRGGLLVGMLASDRELFNWIALDMVYLEFHKKKFPTPPLIAPTLKLVEHRDPSIAIAAIQVLSRIGDKSVMPVLIRVVGSADKNVAEVAFRVIRRVADVNVEFDGATAESRATTARQLEEWWSVHKDTVKLKY